MSLERSHPANEPGFTLLWPRLRRWGLPAAVALACLIYVQTGWHQHWVDLVWAVRDLTERQWPAAFTTWRLWLDGTQVLLGGVTAALLLRFGERRWRYPVAGILLLLAVLQSGMPLPLPEGWAEWLALLPLLGLGGVVLRTFTERPPITSRVLAAGYLAVLIGALIWQWGNLPTASIGSADDLGRPWGSVSVSAFWLAVLRPTLRNLGWVILLLCGALVWLERSPGVLKSGLRRGMVYLTLSVATALTFTVIVGLLGQLLPLGSQFWLLILAATVVAVGMEPARRALDQRIRLLLFGERDNAARVLQRLSQQLSGTRGSGLEGALAEIGRTLQLSHLKLVLLHGESFQYGEGLGAGPQLWESFPLVVQGERIGALEVLRRSPSESFSADEIRLLSAVAEQLAVAAHRWQLAAQLAQTQEHLIRAGEEERLRLRRDLHDGLGPALSALGLKVEAARLLLARSPEAAERHLEGLKTEIQDSVGEVRRIVHDLRPPKLDDLGLHGALQELVTHAGQTGLRASLEVRPDLPALDAATQVALYRIAQEGVTNVLKHAQASELMLRLYGSGEQGKPYVVLECLDNGVGLPAVREAGVGSRSMRERAGALSGTLELTSLAGGGTQLRALIPISLQAR